MTRHPDPRPAADNGADELSEVLHRTAEGLVPATPSTLGAVLARAHDPASPVGPGYDQDDAHPRGRRWVPLAAAAAVVLAVSGGVVTGVLTDRDDPSPTQVAQTPTTITTPPTVTASPSPGLTQDAQITAEPSPSDLPATATGQRGQAALVASYWVGGPQGRRALYREFRPGKAGVTAAVRSILEGTPTDPDLHSIWKPAKVSATVSGPSTSPVVHVDLSPEAFAATGVDAEQARVAVQQLVYTATAAVKGSSTVKLTVGGRTGYRAWGRLTLPATLTRDPQARAAIWIIDPQQGGTVKAGSVRVTGSGHAFEGTISWEVSTVTSTGRGKVIDKGFVTTRGDGVPAAFAFSVKLAPGRYQVIAYEEDASGGESTYGPRQNLDSKEFVVR